MSAKRESLPRRITITTPRYARRVLAGVALAAIFTVTGCETQDQPDTRTGVAEVLRPADLSAKPSARKTTATVPDPRPECDVNGAASWDDSRYDAEVVKYSGIDGDTILSAIWTSTADA